MVHLDYRDARPIYTQIADGFRQQIIGGILQVGDKLPSVRELEAAGWIATVAGKGCFVHSIPNAAPDQQTLLAEFDRLTDALRACGMTTDALIRHLQEGGK